ncbi:hypothetical protein BBH99_00205 [Chryseobacterium contaminans]|uniref:Alpha-ketoglutarate-dependent dioxygenase AlkB-like domain-containing protein n=1 Tax=Chryseobacterium contaminans TaxID=1423959 RepID=A0ABX2XFZ3_9FLAO|nr:alpha-ketoglutarate-dependent dioxygenase AlkB [Chryseobacterium contaminans]OCA80559.1 hypothetical protein BBH99_00205 [Chryseobacterium contaminans]
MLILFLIYLQISFASAYLGFRFVYPSYQFSRLNLSFVFTLKKSHIYKTDKYSLGQTRNFDFRKMDHHQSKYNLPLTHGSLLIMKGDLQEYWEHRIAKSTIPMKERINLTFRFRVKS